MAEDVIIVEGQTTPIKQEEPSNQDLDKEKRNKMAMRKVNRFILLAVIGLVLFFIIVAGLILWFVLKIQI